MSAREHLSPNQRAWRRFLQNRIAVMSAIVLGAMGMIVMAMPLLVPEKANDTDSSVGTGMLHHPDAHSDFPFTKPNSRHLFGTDIHGRDLLSRVVIGARVSLIVGFVGALVSLVIGVTWGALAGYLGGRWDNWMMRGVDVLYSLPSIVFVIVLVTTLNGLLDKWQGSSQLPPGSVDALKFIGLFAGLGAVSWLTMARIVRGQVLTLRTRAFVDASRALGASSRHILWRHILPNTAGIIIVYLMLTIPSIVLYESFLSYLGLGIQPPQASLGSLIADGALQINPVRIYWWLLVFPSAMLVGTLLALNFVGDGLRDAFDPRGDT